MKAKLLFRLLTALSFLFGILPVQMVQAAAPANMLQFTASGHALGFAAGGMYAATGSHALHVDFVGANAIRPQADSPTSADGKAAPLSRVTYANLWDGITLTYTADAGSVYTTTYTLAPGANPADIRMRYNAPLTLNEDGTLDIAFETGAMTESAPIASQEIDGRRVPVNVSFRVSGQEVSFALGAYDQRFALTIDPSLVWNTFLGGGGTDVGSGIAVDGSGNVYVTGYSDATWGSPVRAYAGGFDTFVAKLSSSGGLTWNTFLGGSGIDNSDGIAIDGSGNVYVIGYSTGTWGSPVRAYGGGSYDAFVAKLDSSGALIWNTFLGGSGYDDGRSIAADGSGNVYVTGDSTITWGSPVRAYGGGSYDAFVAKLSSSGGLTWNTFLGGTGEDQARGIAVNESGNVYVAGYSSQIWGSPLRGYGGGSYDAFVAQLNSSGWLTWNTFLGGSGIDNSNGIALDGSGNVYVTGYSTGTWGSPRRAYGGGSYDAFVAKLDSSGPLIWNTFLGGGGTDNSSGIAIDGSGNVYVTGYSGATWGSPVRAYGGGSYDAFVAKLSSSGGLTWNTFLGGSGIDDGYGIAADGSGTVYVTGYSDTAWGSPVRAYTAGIDAFVAKVDLNEYTLTFNITGNGTVTPSIPAPYLWGDVVDLTPIPDEGWSFSEWSGACSGSGACSVTMGGNKTVGATFTQNEYTLTVDITGNGTVDHSISAPYHWGDVVDLTPVPDLGWSFSVWSGACTGSGACSVTMDGNKTVGATFTQNEYTLTVDITGNGTVTPSISAPYHWGDVVDLTPDPGLGWSFSAWSGACTGSGACSVTIDGNKTIGATFIQICYTLTLSHSGSGDDPTADPDNSSGCPSGQYHADESISLLASPAGGWRVDSWSGTDNNSSTSLSNTLTMPAADHTVTVNYGAIPLPGAFSKTSPTNGSYAFTNPTLSWGASSDADSYEYCIDTTNNGACDGSWISTGTSTSAVLSGLTNNRAYYWQVRATNTSGTTDANGGTWWNFTARNQTFADVPIDHSLWQYIEAFYSSGITTGCGVSPLIYCPNNPVTRAAMAVFILRAKYGSGYTPPAATHTFADLPVAGKEWQEAWVDQFYLEGITTGCGTGPLIYCPETAVTRAAMAVFILRAKYGSSYAPPAASHFFSDLPVAGKEWMEPWVDELYREGITTGCGTGPLIYCPETAVKRQAMAAFIVRAFNLPMP